MLDAQARRPSLTPTTNAHHNKERHDPMRYPRPTAVCTNLLAACALLVGYASTTSTTVPGPMAMSLGADPAATCAAGHAGAAVI